MEIRDNLSYTSEHEWILIENNEITVGITDFAQKELGDIVYLELPELDTVVDSGDIIGTIESVKAVSELFCSLTGKITAVNKQLEEEPELVNKEPYDGGWMIKLKIDPDEIAESKLLSPDEYRALTDE